MHIDQATPLACPLDGRPLQVQNRQLACDRGHTFDIARQGYVHLLPVQHKRSRNPGDSKAMVQARTRFLDAGFYEPISQQLNRLAIDRLVASGTSCIVDAGCGEGYYLTRLAHALATTPAEGTTCLAGFDIAKAAVIAAAKRSQQITWLVASNKQPPLLPASVDMIFCMFGFPDYAAFRKILKPGGKIVLVDAGPEHLIELRNIIYPEVRRRPPPSIEPALGLGFNLTDASPLQYRTAALDREQISDLLLMTPHLYRAKSEGKQAAARLTHIAVTVDVLFRVLECPRTG